LRDAGLLAESDVGLLQEAYKALRAAAHRLALQKQPGKVAGDQLAAERRNVMRLWNELGLA
jgi:glutamate-ammonia-ligase adenylyltransferase